MGDLNSSLTAVVGGNGAGSVPAVPEVQPEETQQPVESSQTAAKPTGDVLGWDKDERYERIWKKDPNGLYKSYKELEKVYEPAKQKLSVYEKQVNELNTLAKEFGITPEQLKDVLTEHKTYKDPNNPNNVVLGNLERWLNTPELSDKVKGIWNDLLNEEMRVKYPNMNAEQIKKQVELENRQAEMEKKLNTYEHEKLVGQYSDEIRKSEQKVKEYAKSKGFEVTNEIWAKVLRHCHENRVETKNIPYAFRELYDAEVDKVYFEKVKQDQLKALNKNKGETILPAGTAAKPSVSGGLRSMLNKALSGT